MKTKSSLKSKLLREIKTSHIAKKIQSERLYQEYQSQLDSVMSDESYRLVTFEETVYFTYSLYHDCRSAIGFHDNSESHKFLLSKQQFYLFLSTLSEIYNSECVLLCSSYRDVLPSILTNLQNLCSHTDLFLSLLENNLLVVSEDLSHTIAINSEELPNLGMVGVDIVGSRYLLKLEEILMD